MKLNIGIKELIDFIANGSNAEEVKKTIAGAFIAIANDPVIEFQLRERLNGLADHEARKVFEEAVAKGYNGKSVHGWAADMVKKVIEVELKGVSLQAVVQQAIKDEMVEIRSGREKLRKEVKELVEYELTALLPSMWTLEYSQRIANKYDDSVLRNLVSEACVEFMRKSFKG